MVPLEENINSSHSTLPSSFAVQRAEFWILRPSGSSMSAFTYKENNISKNIDGG